MYSPSSAHSPSVLSLLPILIGKLPTPIHFLLTSFVSFVSSSHLSFIWSSKLEGPYSSITQSQQGSRHFACFPLPFSSSPRSLVIGLIPFCFLPLTFFFSFWLSTGLVFVHSVNYYFYLTFYLFYWRSWCSIFHIPLDICLQSVFPSLCLPLSCVYVLTIPTVKSLRGVARNALNKAHGVLAFTFCQFARRNLAVFICVW